MDKVLLKELFKAHSGLYPYTLHIRYSVTPKQVYEFIQKLKANKIIEVVEDKIYLTKDGKNKILNRELKVTSESKLTDNIPDHLKSSRTIAVGDFYLPRIENIDKFKKKEG